jgi:glycosyltransferase involved in cell wall biosynthesis
MKRAAIVWHGWNAHTHSFDFFRDLLAEKFKVTEIEGLSWTESYNKNVEKLNSKDFEAIVFCQTLPTATYLRKLNCKKIFWLPMYDGAKGWKLAIVKSLFYRGLDLRVIVFSKKLHNTLKLFFNCQYYQYYPKPPKKIKDYRTKRLLFWERRTKPNWKYVKDKLIDIKELDFITIKQFNDPLFKNEKPKTSKKIKLIDKWLSKKKYENLLDECNIFIAPRLTEGIGHSFLEPLSRGAVLIANDDSTMNEYIEHQKTGFLFEYNNPKKIDLSNFEEVGKNARKQMENGYKKWQKDKERIINWIKD